MLEYKWLYGTMNLYKTYEVRMLLLTKIQDIIEKFMKLIVENKIEIYNEFSFQHELGIYLRQSIESEKYLVQFERNVSFFHIDKSKTIKKEIDIVIYNMNKSEKYGIELKHPLNGQYPESMYSFIKDIKFCEQLVENGFKGAVSLVAVTDKLFYEGSLKEGIYKYFRGSTFIYEKINKPTGNQVDSIWINGRYRIDWKPAKNSLRYYTVLIEANRKKDIRESKQIDIEDIRDTSNISVSKKTSSGNLGIEGVCNYIRKVLYEAKKKNIQSITLVSGQLHKDIGLSNAMPTVCNAMRKIAKEYPESIIRKPDTVKSQYSSTISVEYKLI